MTERIDVFASILFLSAGGIAVSGICRGGIAVSGICRGGIWISGICGMEFG